jgi:polyisoprenoid-binding protein YceI
MKLFLALTLLSLSVSAKKPAAQKSTESIKAAAPAEGKSLSFKEAGGKVEFLAVGKPAMIKIVGEGPGPQGDLKIVDDKLQGTLSIDMTKLTTKINLRDDHMKNKYLEVGKYPTAEIIFKDQPFKLSELSTEGSEKPFSADLKLHGITKPVSGKIKLSQSQTNVSGVATFKITVTDYLDTLPSYAGIKVADEVEVTVDLKTISQ